MPLSIDGRLLCASTQAYQLRALGPAPDTFPPPAPPRSALIGFAAPPTGDVSGLDLIDAGMVGTTPDGLVVAFRGTLPPRTPDHAQTILDWASDADAPLVSDPGFPGLVHQGFLEALDALWPALQPLIQTGWGAQPSQPVYVTGHSKGGALANLAAVRIKAMLPAANVVVRTFAAARCGDNGFAAGYAAAITDCLRYEYADDIVPHLPPGPELLALFQGLPLLGPVLGQMTAGYASVGDLRYIGSDGSIQGDSAALQAARRLSLTARLRVFDVKTIADDHGIDLGSGYAQAVCPGV